MGIKGNSMGKPKLPAKIRNVQTGGKGLAQQKKNPVAKAAKPAVVGKGPKQTKNPSAKIAAPARKGTNGLNKAPIKAQPKKPGFKKNALNLHNSVTSGDVSRMRKAHNLAMPKMGSGGFKSFIQGN